MLERDKKWEKLSNMRTTSEGLEELPNYDRATSTEHNYKITAKDHELITFLHNYDY